MQSIHISRNDIRSKVSYERIEQKKALNNQARLLEKNNQEKASLIHRGWFNLLIAGFVGGLLAWMIVEPIFDDNAEGAQAIIQGFLFFSSVGGIAGILIGAMEGFLARNYQRALKGAFFGLAIGFGGGLVSTYVSGVATVIAATIGYGMVGDAISDPVHNFSGFFAIIVVRGIGWAIAGMTVGLGPGIALKSKELARNGFLGGMIGAVIGGVLFDPINWIVSGGTLETGVEISRAFGMTLVGAGAGLMIGLVESATKKAWLLMVEGPLKGKEFILYKDLTNIGSSPACEIYLYKDGAVEPYHAKIEKIRDGYELIDNKTRTGISINNTQMPRKSLATGDEIKIGKAKFIFSEK